MNETIKASIKKVQNILSQNIVIPDYQRPYRWNEDNVRLLLQDIYESWRSGKNAYRVGSVILHTKDFINFNIVDGQQRITTLLLIFKVLKSPTGADLCNSLTFQHSESQNRIIANFTFIKSWLSENLGNEQDSFSKYLSLYCEFVEIIVKELSEAFQMFDAQNGRGKELETYNLLKAYHIRAMEWESSELKIACDQKWENSTRYLNCKSSNENETFDLLKQIFDEQLFRTRVWSRKEEANNFTKKNIAEFKGFSLSKNSQVQFPFQNKALLQYIVRNYYDTLGVEVKGIKGRLANMDSKLINPFVSLNQDFINGKEFFEYVETYVEIYKFLFTIQEENSSLSAFRKFYQNYCESYTGSNRDGDRYLKELYKSLLFLIYDKYGEDGLNRYYKILYGLVYKLRLEKYQVKYAFVAQYPAQQELFSIIENSKSYVDLQKLERLGKSDLICNKEISHIIPFFIENGYSFNQEKSSVDLTPYKNPV